MPSQLLRSFILGAPDCTRCRFAAIQGKVYLADGFGLMALNMNTNLYSQVVSMNLDRTERRIGSSIGRLSSGKQIYSAADNAAGLSVSEGMAARSRSLNRAIQNTNEGISLVNAADNGLRQISSVLTKMRELSIQAMSDHLTSADRVILDNEWQSSIEELTRIATNTEYNGINIIGTELDPDLPPPTVNIQVGAGTDSGHSISVSIVDATRGGIGLRDNGGHLLWQNAATATVSKIDDSIEAIGQYRSDYGAVLNRLSAAARSLGEQHLALKSSESNVVSLDIAEETSHYTRLDILRQAASSVLAQANTSPQAILSLF